MCSACMTMRPRASNSAVEASRRSLMLAECAERTSTAPISSQAARSAPSMTWRVTGSRPLSAPSPPRRHRSAPASRAGPRASSRAARRWPGRRARLRRGPARPRPAARRRRERRAFRARSAGPAAAGGGSAPGSAAATRTVTSSSWRLGVRVAVALLVRAVEGLAQLVRIGLERAVDRQLERLAGVAQVERGAQLRMRLPELVAGLRRPAARRPRRWHRRSGRRPPSSTLSTTSRRRSETISPRAESTPEASGAITRRMPSSSAIWAACSGPAPPNATSASSRGSMPRSIVTTRTAWAISAAATRAMPAAASSVLRPSSPPSVAHGAAAGLAIQAHSAGQRRARRRASRAAGRRR